MDDIQNGQILIWTMPSLDRCLVTVYFNLAKRNRCLFQGWQEKRTPQNLLGSKYVF
jgi:hypothetical protein